MERKLKAQCMESVGELPAGYLHLPTTPIKQEPQLTDWFPPEIKPVHIGWYHTGNADSNPNAKGGTESKFNWYWDGKYWRESPQGSSFFYAQDRYWRGRIKS